MDRGASSPFRRTAATAAVFLLLAAAAAGPALGQARVPFPPIDGLIERPADFEPLPRERPTIIEHYASACMPPHPELAWAALPQDLREVTYETMIGQLLMVSFGGNTPDSPGVAAARDALARGEIGGVIAFRQNIASADDTRAINRMFHEAHPDFPAMIAVDQEGGAVTRVKPSEGAPATPSARDIAKGSVREAVAHYEAMAEHLADLGFTINFGPVVDLEVNPENPIIARFGRSYGTDPAEVVKYARAFVRAHREAGLATALKHFPGHGSSTDDSHEDAIDLTPTWTRIELLPFVEMIRSGEADMVMLGHLDLEGLTGPDDLPASLSPRTIDEFLREALCYDGIVVSDDLHMQAVSSRWQAPEAAVKMIEAGGDIILFSLPAGGDEGGLPAVRAALLEAAERSPGFADRLRHAYARVVHHKLDMAAGRTVSSRTGMPPERQWAEAR